MKKVKMILSVIIILSIVIGFFYILKPQEPSNVNESQTSFEEDISSEDSIAQQASRNIMSENVKTTKEIKNKNFYKENKYFQSIIGKKEINKQYEKTLDYFEDSSNKEDIAAWVSIGMIFETSPEYEEIFLNVMGNLNRDSNNVYKDIERAKNKLTSKDSFMRSQILNLVNKLSVDTESKVNFFGSEISRQVILDKQGKLSPDSHNITIALNLLHTLKPEKNQVLDFYKQSMNNNPDPAARTKIKNRFLTYFPDLLD